jgi:hypothetical protein
MARSKDVWFFLAVFVSWGNLNIAAAQGVEEDHYVRDGCAAHPKTTAKRLSLLHRDKESFTKLEIV